MAIYKIHLGESALILADAVPPTPTDVQMIGLEELDLAEFFNASKTPVGRPITYLFVSANVVKIFESMLQMSNLIQAAGGLLRNSEGQCLFIHRLGKWDLPKGKVEAGENTRQAALREVEEECGIRPDFIGAKISTTYHTYVLNGKFILKQTDWYEMAVNGSPEPIPQTEEGITEAKWFAPSEFDRVRENTYPLILELL